MILLVRRFFFFNLLPNQVVFILLVQRRYVNVSQNSNTKEVLELHFTIPIAILYQSLDLIVDNYINILGSLMAQWLKSPPARQDTWV